jgi:hypothetical protein
MQNYITQLLTDMKAAEKNLPTIPDPKIMYPDHRAHDYDLPYIAEWEMSPRHSMDDLFGIKAAQFPPEDKLTDDQAEQLITGILELWASHRILADFPEVVPTRTLYTVLLNRWANEPTQFISAGNIHLEFCHYEPAECPWGLDYCTCKEFANDYKDVQPIDDPEWKKGIIQNDAGGFRWINPDLLDENGDFDPSKLPEF